MKLKDGFILREVAGDIVVIPSGEVLDLDMMISLNETACFMWKLLENGTTEDALVAALLGEYEISEDDARKCVIDFGEKLNEYGFLE